MRKMTMAAMPIMCVAPSLRSCGLYRGGGRAATGLCPNARQARPFTGTLLAAAAANRLNRRARHAPAAPWRDPPAMPHDSPPIAAPSAEPGDDAILSDPEWALLAGVRATCSMPADVVSKAALLSHAEVYGAFSDGRLDQALESLLANGSLIE